MIHLEAIRADFPILTRERDGHPIVYLDNAATTQMPACVIERMRSYCMGSNANVHRASHALGAEATRIYEEARERTAAFIGAPSSRNIIFTSGTTHSINIVAGGLRHLFSSEDPIAVTSLEHHSNLLPWQQLCKETGARLEWVACPNGCFSMEDFHTVFEQRPSILALTQVSNLTGSAAPLQEIIAAAHAAGTAVLVDGAQGVRHDPRAAVEAGADYYCFSGHKTLGPSGIGVLYAADAENTRMQPSSLGGGMVDRVTRTGFTPAPFPYCFEAGTPNHLGAAALASAFDYLDSIGTPEIHAREKELTHLTAQALLDIPRVRILGSPKERIGCVSFVVEGFDPYDIAMMLDHSGICVRAGTHCAEPALEALGHGAAVRISPAFYNSEEEIQLASTALRESIRRLEKWTKQ